MLSKTACESGTKHALPWGFCPCTKLAATFQLNKKALLLKSRLNLAGPRALKPAMTPLSPLSPHNLIPSTRCSRLCTGACGALHADTAYMCLHFLACI